MTVLDTSAAIDFLLADGVVGDVEELMQQAGTLAAPDLLVFEVLAVLRRDVQRGLLTDARARAAVDDLGDLAIELFPTLALRDRVWELRDNLTAADALFAALAERLEEPLATKDLSLAAAARTHTDIDVIELVAAP